jgi:hypothetical protein
MKDRQTVTKMDRKKERARDQDGCIDRRIGLIAAIMFKDYCLQNVNPL